MCHDHVPSWWRTCLCVCVAEASPGQLVLRQPLRAVLPPSSAFALRDLGGLAGERVEGGDR